MPRSNTPGLVTGIGGALAAIGAFLPWATFRGVSLSGTHELINDGWVTLILGVVALVLAVLMFSQGAKRWHGVVALIASAIILLLTILDLLDSTEGLSFGIGLYMTLIAGVLILIGSILAMRGGGAATPAMAPPPPPPPA